MNENLHYQYLVSAAGFHPLDIGKKLKMVKNIRTIKDEVYIKIRTYFLSLYTKISVFGKNSLKLYRFWSIVLVYRIQKKNMIFRANL